MKKEYNLKDKVWIHIGERKLTEGRVVEIIDLEHLKEGHSPTREFYIIEIKTGIDDIYEVREFDQISPDARGPINMYRKMAGELNRANRMLKKIGIVLPDGNIDPELYNDKFEGDGHDGMGSVDDEPTPEQIHAAIEKSQLAASHSPLNLKTDKPKRRYFKKKKT
jgi:hypothetical protein